MPTAPTAELSVPDPTTPYLHPALAGIPLPAGVLTGTRPVWTPAELAGLTDLLVRTGPAQLRAISRHDPANRWYERLALTGEVEVWLIGWWPRQGTRPHDHGGASGAFTVLDGRLAETYRDGVVPVRRSVVDAGGRSAFGPQRLHVVHNPGRVPATSVHAYSPPLLPLGVRDTLESA
jgi:hypothetical protein